MSVRNLSSIAASAGLVIGRLAGFVLILALARLAAPEALGRIALFLALLEFIDQAFFESNRVAYMRLYPEYAAAGRLGALNLSCLRNMTPGIVAAAPIGALAALFKAPEAVWLTSASLAAAVAGTAAVRFRLAQLRAEERGFAYFGLEALRAGLIVAGAAWAAATGSDQYAATVMALGAAGFACGLVTAGAIAGSARAAGAEETGGQAALALRALAAPFTITLLAAAAMPLVERAAIAANLGTAAVGVYFAVQGMVRQPIGLIGMAIAMPSFVPLTKAMEAGGLKAAGPAMSRFATRLILGLAAGCIGLALTAPDVVAVLLGPDFANPQTAALAVPLALSAGIAGLRDHWLGMAFHLHRRLDSLAFVSILSLAAYLAMIYFGADSFGLQGVAFAALCWSVASFALFWAAASRMMQLRVEWMQVAKIAGALCALVGGVMAAQFLLGGAPAALALAGAVTAGAVIYGAAAFALDAGGVRGLFQGRSGG